MVTSIARQSVIIKCNMQKSVLTGNYEFYYAAGLIAKLSGVEISDDIKPIELGVLLHQEIEKTEPKDEQEKYLFSMLKDYKPTDEGAAPVGKRRAVSVDGDDSVNQLFRVIWIGVIGSICPF